MPTPTRPEVWVYNPDDEPDDAVMFGGHRFVLPANTAIHLQRPADWDEARAGKWDASAVAAHILAHLGQWGICVVSGPVTGGRASNPADQPAVDAAEQVYLRRTTDWAAELMQQYAERSRPFTSVGLPALKRTADEEKAYAWWGANQSRISWVAPAASPTVTPATK